MKAAKSDDRWIIRLDPGDDIIDSLQQWCASEKVYNAEVVGIGSVENPILAHYRRDTKKFGEKALSGIYEITSLIGNVAFVDNAPLVHLHVNISDENMQAFGGHLVKGACSATVEIVVDPLPTRYSKRFDDASGLKIWNLERW